MAAASAACTTRPPLSFAPDSLPDGTVAQPYRTVITISGSQTPVGNMSADAGLPPGLTLHWDESADRNVAELSGTPTTAGTYQLTISAWCLGTNVNGQTGSRRYASWCADARGGTKPPCGTALVVAVLIVGCYPSITIGPDSLPDGAVGQPYSATLSATSSEEIFSIAVATGLPPGWRSPIPKATTASHSPAPHDAGTYTFDVERTIFTVQLRWGEEAGGPTAWWWSAERALLDQHLPQAA